MRKHQILDAFNSVLRMNIINVYFRLNGLKVIHPLIIFTGILLLVYALLILYYHRIWDQIPVSEGSF